MTEIDFENGKILKIISFRPEVYMFLQIEADKAEMTFDEKLNELIEQVAMEHFKTTPPAPYYPWNYRTPYYGTLTSSSGSSITNKTNTVSYTNSDSMNR